ncbi:TIGR03087 family PEP-CTERM/XrtA system glycosyltransferase [Vibrio sp. HN007]|uniref:TIGR03087 family PEP-CTERM/XrtA system glycosyltransferase n=1 Tax=Vibrio iocasae TaxID=3098914 RepID=UPI0035D457D8
MKEKLLYLCHRIPFPANKGDKITTCNILKFLSQHYDVYLGCFIDDPYDEKYKDDVRDLCKEAFFVDLSPAKAKIKGLSAFITGKPITLPHYHSRKMQQWVNSIVHKESIQKAFIYSGCMAQYVLTKDTPELHKVMQFADIDSDKWRQYSDKTKGIMSWVYRREYRTLEKYEKHVAKKFAVSCFISDKETEMFRSMLNGNANSKIQTLSNGIDVDFFSPTSRHSLEENYPLDKENYIVFTGAMGYWANADAVQWFTDNVWPLVYKKLPNSKFYIVGSSPSKQVSNLNEVPGVVITGRVEDVRPYLSHAKAAVAPMQIARGIQNKILEAMAMELPVAATKLGIEGIEKYPDNHIFISDDPEHFAEWVVEKLTHTSHAKESRDWLKLNYSWDAKLSPLLSYLEAPYD